MNKASSELKVIASEELTKAIKEELKKEDPNAEKAKAAIVQHTKTHK